MLLGTGFALLRLLRLSEFSSRSLLLLRLSVREAKSNIENERPGDLLLAVPGVGVRCSEGCADNDRPASDA